MSPLIQNECSPLFYLPAHFPTIDTQAGDRMKILIVEDNETMRRTIKSIVAENADEIYECSDGSEAVALYSECRPDWVLMDIKLKQMDGIEATSIIKALYPDAKIVIVTNYEDEKLQEAAFQAGARKFVLKRRMFDINQILSGKED